METRRVHKLHRTRGAVLKTRARGRGDGGRAGHERGCDHATARLQNQGGRYTGCVRRAERDHNVRR